MPSFIVPMAIRYALVFVAVTIGLTVAVIVLQAYGYIGDKPANLSHIAPMAGGMWAGVYFAKQAGRAAEWSECFRIAVVLVILQTLISAAFTLLIAAIPGSDLGNLMANMETGVMVAVTAVLLFTSLIYWVGTAAFIRLGSKSSARAKKA